MGQQPFNQSWWLNAANDARRRLASKFAGNRGRMTDVLRAAVEAAITAEARAGREHLQDPYWRDAFTGHSVGQDEIDAVGYARQMRLTPSPSEQRKPVTYVNRLAQDFEVLKLRFRRDEPDPDGYGIGTLHAVTNALFRKARELGISAP